MNERTAAPPDNRLSYVDQAMFLWLRAAGEAPVVQMVWIYEHPVDYDALRRFHHAFARGELGRLRIEPSPLPFGRHRWVMAEPASNDLDIAESPRPRAELTDWADERVQLPIDPEYGPGWHMGVLRLTDGSTAVSLVVSHCLTDGLGGFLAAADAIKGNTPGLRYPPAHSRSRRRAIASDARETLRGAPEVARTLGAAAKLGFQRRHDLFGPKASRPAPQIGDDADCNVVVPAVAVHVDLDEWDARANALGAKGHTLLAGFAAKLGERAGRQRADGAVTLLVPTSERTVEDDRANAAALASISVDPKQVTTNLSGVKTAIREGLRSARETPDQPLELLPLIPFVPKRAVKGGADAIFGFAADLPVSCSNLGDLEPAVGRADGTQAEYFILRGVDRHITRRALEQRSGLLTVVAGRLCGNMEISVIAYLPGQENTKTHLRELVASTLAELGLTGRIEEAPPRASISQPPSSQTPRRAASSKRWAAVATLSAGLVICVATSRARTRRSGARTLRSSATSDF
jgi:hypothetical protein